MSDDTRHRLYQSRMEVFFDFIPVRVRKEVRKVAVTIS